MTIDRPRESHGSRRHRSARRSSREQPGIRIEPGRHDSEATQGPVASHRTAPSMTSHQKDEVQGTKRERRRTQRQRSQGSIPSPPIETPITAVLGDLRDDIEETNFSPQHSSTVYGDSGVGEDCLMRGGPHGPVYIENRSGFSQVEIIASPSSSSNNLAEFGAIYGKLSQLFSSLVYILISLCLVSVFDWMDISHADCRQFFDLLSSRPRITWLLVPLYGVALILTFLAARTDEWLASGSAGNYSETANVTERLTEKTDLQMFEIWRIYNILRSVCVLLGWLIIATARPKDLLLQHLKAMLRPTASAPVRLP